MPDLIVDKVEKQFPSRDEPLVVLRGVSLSMSRGENLAIVGPSGSGKSTLLHIIGALDSPTAGTVELDGQNPFGLSEPQLAEFRNSKIGFVFQDHHLLPQLSVLENVLLPAVAHGEVGPDDQARAEDLIQRVGLEKRMDHRPAELSGGEKQRAAVARALLRNPMLVLADEPTGSLDQTNAQAVGRLLLDLQKQEQTMLIVVTHSSELAELLDQQLEFDNGQLVSHRAGAAADQDIRS